MEATDTRRNSGAVLRELKPVEGIGDKSYPVEQTPRFGGFQLLYQPKLVCDQAVDKQHHGFAHLNVIRRYLEYVLVRSPPDVRRTHPKRS